MKEIEQLFDLLSIVPEGIEEHFDLDGAKVHISKKDGNIKVSLSSGYEENEEEEEDAFDDSYIKTAVTEFRKGLDRIDDCLFLEILDELKGSVCLKRFNDLLDLENYTESEATEVANLMNRASAIISKHIKSKIEELTELSEMF